MTNHPNRSRRPSPAANPKPEQVRALREQVQEKENLGITAAQQLCAQAVFSCLRSWQKWERGERRMHASTWEYARGRLEQSSRQ